MPRTGLLLLGALLAGLAVPVAPEGRFAIEVRSVTLNPLDPAQVTAGALRFRGGLWLRASDLRFGGLSDLRIGPDGTRVVMISDCGHVLRATLVHDAQGFLVGLRDPVLESLRAPGGRRLRPGEEDAECLAADGEGGFYVGFERHHRLWRYRGGERPLHGAPVPAPAPAGLAQCPPNLGAEAMTRLPDGRLFVIEEGPPDQPSFATAWVGNGAQWSEWRYPLHYDPGVAEQPFRATSAATLPDGSVLVLERRYPPVAARLRRLSPARLRDGRDLSGEEIARLDPPLTLDNFEGLEAHAAPGGEVRVYLLSDDNNCRKLGSPRLPPTGQRTLILLFVLDP